MAEGGSVLPGDESFAERLRRAVSLRGLSLQSIVQELAERETPVTIATLSYWQSGRSRPERAASLAALNQLEDVLELPSGELSSRLPQRKPRGRYANATPETGEPHRYAPLTEVAHRMMRELELPWNDALTRMSQHTRVHIDRFRRCRRTVHRAVVSSDRDGVEGTALIWVPDDSMAEGATVRPVSNCTLGKLAVDEETGLVVAELRFPRPLDKGQIAMIEFEVRTPRGGTTYRAEERSFRTPVRECVLEMVFDANALPFRVRSQHTTEVDARNVDARNYETIAEIPVNAGIAQMLVLDAAPGHYRMEVAWTEEEAQAWQR